MYAQNKVNFNYPIVHTIIEDCSDAHIYFKPKSEVNKNFNLDFEILR